MSSEAIRRPNPWWEFTHSERRAPISDGGTVAWWEHSLCWDGYMKASKLVYSSESIATNGGFSLVDYEAYIGRLPRTYVK